MSVAESRITLDWPSQPEYRAVGRLVLGGVAARTDLPIDRIEELGLAIDALARAPIAGSRLDLDITVGRSVIAASLGTFVEDPMVDPAVRRVVETLVDTVETLRSPEGHRVYVTAVSSDARSA